MALPVILALAAMRPSRAAAMDILWPATPERRLAAVSFWAPLLVPVAVALVAQFPLTSLWTMSAWSLLPVVLLSSPLTTIGRRDAANIVALAVIVPLVMIAAAPAVAYMVHRSGVTPAAPRTPRCSRKRVEAVWRETSDRPLRLFAGWEDFGYGGRVLSAGPSAGGECARRRSATDLDARIARHGIAMVLSRCARPVAWIIARCAAPRARRSAGGSKSRSRDRYFSVEGETARYVIVTMRAAA